MKLHNYLFLTAITLLCASTQAMEETKQGTKFRVLAALFMADKQLRTWDELSADKNRVVLNFNNHLVDFFIKVTTLENENPTVDIRWQDLDGCSEIGNQSKKDREIVWNKPYFIENQTNKTIFQMIVLNCLEQAEPL